MYRKCKKLNKLSKTRDKNQYGQKKCRTEFKVQRGNAQWVESLWGFFIIIIVYKEI